MHLPNEYIDPRMAAGMGLAAASLLAYAAQQVRKLVTSPVVQGALAAAGKGMQAIGGQVRRVMNSEGQRYLQRLTSVTLLIFAAQMFNFPVSNGTSGHLIGAVLACVLLGPWGGFLSLSIILSVQSLFMGDGGVMVLGVNVMNMALIAGLGGYALYRVLLRVRVLELLALFIAAWVSVVAAAGFCGLEMGLSGVVPLAAVLTAMLRVHAITGLIEGAVTLIMIKVLWPRLYPNETDVA